MFDAGIKYAMSMILDHDVCIYDAGLFRYERTDGRTNKAILGVKCQEAMGGCRETVGVFTKPLLDPPSPSHWSFLGIIIFGIQVANCLKCQIVLYSFLQPPLIHMGKRFCSKSLQSCNPDPNINIFTSLMQLFQN